jgi:deoxyribonuclease-1-like protein
MTSRYLLVIILLLICTKANTTTITSFNIQNFGQSKMGKPSVVKIIVNILARYDVIAIMEIRNTDAIYELVSQLNNFSDKHYDVILSERLGNSSRKEQYAFVYDTNKVQIIEKYQYIDTDHLFSRSTTSNFRLAGWPRARERSLARPPFGVIINVENIKLFLQVFHAVYGKKANNEIAQLRNVYDSMLNDDNISIKNRYIIKNAAILMGDYNCDCQSIKKQQFIKNPLFTDQRFTWPLYGTPTNLNGKCSYDQFVINKEINGARAYVFDFMSEYELSYDEAKNISDHFPIVLEITNDPDKKKFILSIIGCSIVVVCCVCVSVILCIIYCNRKKVNKKNSLDQFLLSNELYE